MRIFALFTLILLASMNASAGSILMARSSNNFEVTMQVAKKSIEAHGYTIAHVQRCDGGLSDFGYKTDRYRLLFIGKPDEIRQLTQRHPEMIPYLPLKLAIYAEEGETLAAIFNPEELAKFFQEKELKVQFARWKSDFDSILDDIRKQ
jgi:uncharacterized protein (DUF302 family)